MPGRTLDWVISHIRGGGERLEMPELPPPSPPCAHPRVWLRRALGSSSRSSSSSGPVRSSSRSSCYRSSPYSVLEREVKEESLVPLSDALARGIVIDAPWQSAVMRSCRSGTEPARGVQVEGEGSLAEYYHRQGQVASREGSENTPGLREVMLTSMDDHRAWEGDVDAIIRQFIIDAGLPLVDLTDDGGAGCNTWRGGLLGTECTTAVVSSVVKEKEEQHVKD